MEVNTTERQLELTWAGKQTRTPLASGVLTESPEHSYRSDSAERSGDLFDNRLVEGDNLVALHALQQEFEGRIRCVYIDPPFNTQQAFEHYEDGIDHPRWLGFMRDRLELIHRLLADDGTLFVHIDDNELAYLSVLLDEIFGRENRASLVTFKQGSATGHKAINAGCVSTANYILIYARNRKAWKPRRLFTARDRDRRYNQFVRHREGGPERWEIIPLMRAYAEHAGLDERAAREAIRTRPARLDRFVQEFASQVIRMARPNKDAVSKQAQALIERSLAQPDTVFWLPRDPHKDFYFLRGERILFYQDKLKTVDGELVAAEPLTTIWDDLLSNNLHKEGGIHFPKGKKPEALLKRVIELATNPGDWVLDAFAGSGTTGAAAHKLGRRWIMMELGDHCETHIAPRLRGLIDGRDSSGITGHCAWGGGGGFRYFRLGLPAGGTSST